MSWNLRDFTVDLSRFIDLIGEKKVPGDFSELSTLLSQLNTRHLVHYKIENLCFHIKGRIPGAKPDEMHYCQVFFDNMLMVRDPFVCDRDPLHGYYLNINIEVYKSENNTEKGYHSSWHLDRHPNVQNVKYTHPVYHFQFGGKKMEYLDPSMSLLSCPRIPHPPMDLFLGFHFIISNFFSNKHFAFVDELLSDSDYQTIIRRAQDRLWQPYFYAFDGRNTNQDFVVKKVFPLYI